MKKGIIMAISISTKVTKKPRKERKKIKLLKNPHILSTGDIPTRHYEYDESKQRVYLTVKIDINHGPACIKHFDGLEKRLLNQGWQLLFTGCNFGTMFSKFKISYDDYWRIKGVLHV